MNTYIYPVTGAPAQPSATGTNSGLLGVNTQGVQQPLPATNINYHP